MSKIYFEEELQMIQNEEVRNCVIEVLKNVKEEFYHAPASSSGKYHPEYALGDGGLYRHTKAAVKIANDILSLEWFNKEFTDDDKDVIIAAIILHDTCKSGKDWDNKYTMHTHPIQAGDLVEDTLRDTEHRGIGEEIARLIRSHMGQWNEPGRWNKYNDRTVLPKPEELDEFVVHLCDYLASRKYLEVNGIYDVEE
jgi:hypothetical protein